MSDICRPESATASFTAVSACAASGISAERVTFEKPTPLTATLHRFSHMRLLPSLSFDDCVGNTEQGRRKCKIDRPSGRQVEDQRKPVRLVHRDFAHLASAEDPVNLLSHAAAQLRTIGAIGH